MNTIYKIVFALGLISISSVGSAQTTCEMGADCSAVSMARPDLDLTNYVMTSPDVSNRSALKFFRDSMLSFGYHSVGGRVYDVVSTLIAFDVPTDTYVPGIGRVDANLRQGKLQETLVKRLPGGETKYIIINTDLVFVYNFTTGRFDVTVQAFTVREYIVTPVGSSSSAG